ncbi:MAG: NUDIX hydrolase [Lachnospiraceae bacterium]|nr:NUDIX hydrolase [Lachnospiraceae bacterium]
MTFLEQLKNYEPYNDEEAIIKPIILEFLQQNENAFSRENVLAHMTTSAWIVNKERTKVLMAYHNIYNSWGWLGGHADGDEDLLRVVQKEVAEESGLINIRLLYDGIYGINILTVFPHYKRGKYVNAHLHFDVEYLFEADEEDAVRMKPDENSGVGWVPIEEINQYVTEEHMKPVYVALNEKLKMLV